LEIDIQRRAPSGDAAGFEADITIQVPNWGSGSPQPCPLTVKGFWLCSNALAEMTAAMEIWSELPLATMAETEFEGVFELAGRSAERLCVRFGPRADTIAARHPVVTVSIAGPLHAELHFSTDQSCLAAFATELDTMTGFADGM
jgi:hypothetical protein